MAYAIVEFNENDGGGVAAVNSAWLTPLKKEVFWPPYKEQNRFEKALKTGEEVDSKKWHLYSIKRLFYSTDDIVKVRQKLQQAQVTSNLESEEEIGSGRPRRKRCIRRFSDSTDEEQNELLPRPPLIKRTKHQFSQNAHKDCNAESIISAVQSSIDSNSILSSRSSTSTHSIHSTPQHTQKAVVTLDHIERLTSLVARIKEQNDQILDQIARQSDKNLNVASGLPDIPFSFPLSTIEEMNDLDSYLREHNNHFVALSSYLSSLGGNHVPGRTNRILKFILTDVVAIQFNFYGKRSEKRAFADLLLKDLIIGAVKRAIVNSTEKDIEDAIKVWLKHAQDRMRKSK